MGSILIGVCGGSGSGKSTIARKIITEVGDDRVVYLQQDHYYRDMSALPIDKRHHINFDHPDSIDFTLLTEHARELLNGNGVDQPIYDFATHARTGEHQHLEPQPVIIVDGILIFTQPELRNLMSLKIFVDTDADIRFIRRQQRDMQERGRTRESVIAQYLSTVRPMHLEMVEPSRRYADLIIPEGGNSAITIDLVTAWIKMIIGREE